MFLELVPGAKGQAHTTIPNAAHFLQEDQGPLLAQVVNQFMLANPLPKPAAAASPATIRSKL